MNKKSQAALEFLTTYAWAFLVIILMVSALAYFGILRPNRLLPDRCNFGTEIGCIDYQITYGTGADGTFDIRLKNGRGEPITIPAVATTGITLSSESVTIFSCTLNQINGAAPLTDYSWGTGVITDFSFDTCNTGPAGFSAGDKAKVDITITYFLAKSGIAYTHQVQGEIFTGVI